MAMMWRERIQAARQRGVFTQEDRMDAGCIGSTTSYRLCAVGEQADRMGSDLIFDWPKDRVGVTDPLLRDLGGQFAGCVAVGDFDEAEHVLDVIENRALCLKREGTR